MENHTDEIEKWRNVVERISADIVQCHPKAVVLFGSMARYLAGTGSLPRPNDIDLFVVVDNPLLGVAEADCGLPVELHRYRVREAVLIARCLRYDPKPMALSKLYGKNVAKQHARDVIAACLLLGPDYNAFGVEQIEIDGRTDTRDYSVHQVLHGQHWWRQLTAYARKRRGPLSWVVDKMLQLDRFDTRDD